MFCSSCGAQTADGSAFCGSCGRPLVGYSVGASAAAPAAVYAGGAQAGAQAYAGFWLRFVAAIIDGLILGIPFAFIVFLSIASLMPTLIRSAQNADDPRNAMMIMAAILPRVFFMGVLFLAAGWLYWGLLESSAWQATLGKKALGLYVTDLSGARASFGRASGRYFAGRGISLIYGIGGLYYLIDCIMAGFTERKQALHDMIAGCLVMRSN